MKVRAASSPVSKLIMSTLCFLMFCGGLGLASVWGRHAIASTANHSRILEGNIASVERLLNEVDAKVSAAQHPDALNRQNQAMKLDMATPSEVQVIRVDESPELRLATKHRTEAPAPMPAMYPTITVPSFNRKAKSTPR